MSIKILKKEYSELYTGAITNWMLGNVGDWQKATIEVAAGVDFQAAPDKPIEIDYINNAFKISNGDKWGDYGFDIGMDVTLKYVRSIDADNDGVFESVTTEIVTYNILNISGNSMTVDTAIDVGGFDTMPINYGTKKLSDVIFYSDKNFEGCKLVYDHVDRDQLQSGQVQSVIDGTKTEFKFDALNLLPAGNFGTMTPIGLQSGMSVKSVRMKELPRVNGVAGKFDINPSASLNLRIQNSALGSSTYNSARCISMNLLAPVTHYQTVPTASLMSQSNSAGQLQNAAASQCFIYNHTGASYTQQLRINFNFKIVSVFGAMVNANGVRARIIKYDGGTSLDFLQQTEIKRWENVNTLINNNLNINQIIDIDVNAGESYALVLDFYHSIPLGNPSDRSVNYVVQGGFVEFSEQNDVFPDVYKRGYVFEIDYMISSLFENLDTFENVTPPDYLVGDLTISDNIKINLFPIFNNPNISVSNDVLANQRSGNVGWFNENYNQLANHFAIENVIYYDANNNVVESVDYAVPTKVTGIIKDVPNVSASTVCGFGFAWTPKDEADFKNLSTPFYRNVFAQTGSYTNAYNVGTFYPAINTGAGLGGSIDSRNIRFTNLGGGRISFEVYLVPNAGFTSFFDARTDEDRNYIFWVSVADSTLARNLSDRVNLLADINTMVKNVPLAGAYPNIYTDFLNHPAGELEAGEDTYDGFIVDDVLARMPFTLDYLTSKIEKMKFGIEVYNPATGQRKVLERLEYNMAIYPNDANGVPQYSLDTTQVFKLESGNNKNWVKIQREPTLDATGQSGYLAYYAFKCRYEDWLPLADVPSDFFDNTKPNNGFNNDWLHYYETVGWKLAFFTEIDINENGDLKEYRNRWDVKLKSSDTNTLLNCEHKYYRDSDNSLLNIGSDPETGRPLGVIMNNEKTRIEISYEILDAGTWDARNIYAVTTIEIDKGAGITQLRQLSSVWRSEPDNPLVPVAGDTNLRVVVSGDLKKVTTKCLVDPDLLDGAERYRITGRIGCYAGGGDPPVGFGLYEDRYEDKYE